MVALAAWPLFLLPWLVVASRVARLVPNATKDSSRRSPAVTVEAGADEVAEIRSLISGVRKVTAELKAEEADPKINPERRKHTRRLLNHLHNEVADVLPSEMRALKGLFDGTRKGVAAPNPVERARSMLGKRLAKKFAKRHPLKANNAKDASECGEHIRASSLGLKRGRKVAQFFGTSFLQHKDDPEGEEDYVSFALPGAGADQVLKDEGRSKLGTLRGVGKDAHEEPYLTVYKDGFFRVGCVSDVMAVDFDKYGNNKDKYSKDADRLNVSIAIYKELVLEEAQEPMQPRICFEFCRTLDNMGFFGIQNGGDCYCMPFYKAGTGGEGDMCTVACPGSEGEMCGGKKKSSVFEMHTCGDKEGQLVAAAVPAGEALAAFYAASVFSQAVANDLQKTAEIVQEVAGQAGDPDSGDYAQAAKMFAGDVKHVMNDGQCLDDYNVLLATYEESESISLLNMKQAKNLQKANDAAASMQELIPKVQECTKKAAETIALGYPPYPNAMDSETDAAFKEKQERYATAIAQYLPLMFVIKSQEKPKASTCTGEIVGKPTVASLPECAQACDDLVFPEKCIAFQFYHAEGTTESSGNLCFLLKEVKSLITYDCEMTSDLVDGEKDRVKEAESAGALLQSGSSEDPPAPEIIARIDKTMCDNVLSALSYTAMTCNDAFGTEASVKDTCSAVCERSKGAKYAATCMSKVSEVMSITSLKEKENKRCFAGNGRNVEVDGPEPGPQVVPFDENGVVLAGDVTLGSVTILEPIVWTVPPEEQ